LHVPRGFSLKFILHSTWGDLNYIGLNGLEIYDHSGTPILEKKLFKYNYYAEPTSINVMYKKDKRVDIRTIDKIFN
jgi:hypothetical protein